VYVVICSKVKHLDTELHIATTTLKSLELSESKVQMLMLPCLLEDASVVFQLHLLTVPLSLFLNMHAEKTNFCLENVIANCLLIKL